MFASSAELRVLAPQAVPILNIAANGGIALGHPVHITGDDGCFQENVAVEAAKMCSSVPPRIFGISELSVRIDILAAALNCPTFSGHRQAVVIHGAVPGVYQMLRPHLMDKSVFVVGPADMPPAEGCTTVNLNWLARDQFDAAVKTIYAAGERKIALKDKLMTDMLWQHTQGCPELLVATIEALRVVKLKSEVVSFMEQQENVVKEAEKILNVIGEGNLPAIGENIRAALTKYPWRQLATHVKKQLGDSVLRNVESSVSIGLHEILEKEVNSEAQLIGFCLGLAEKIRGHARRNM